MTNPSGLDPSEVALTHQIESFILETLADDLMCGPKEALSLEKRLIDDIKADPDDVSFLFVERIERQFGIHIPPEEWRSVATGNDVVALVRRWILAQERTLEGRILRLVARESGIRPKRLYQDKHLKINEHVFGAQAGTLMKAFAVEFGIDMKNYRHSHYFLENKPTTLRRLHRVITRSSREEIPPLTIDDLVRVASEGAWVLP